MAHHSDPPIVFPDPPDDPRIDWEEEDNEIEGKKPNLEEIEEDTVDL